MKHIRNLVFEGGGVKGIAYCGALSVLEEKGILKNCSRFAGTSAGAITAWLLSYYKDDLSKIEQIQKETKFDEFADDSAGILRDSSRLLNRYGWHKGDEFYKFAKDITKERFGKRHISFKELFDATGNDLTMVACNASKGKTVYFSKDTTPDFYVERALRITMSIPVYFRGIFIPDDCVSSDGNIIGNPGIDKDVGKYRDIFVDGGVLENYPVQIFDTQAILANPLNGEKIVLLPNRSPEEYNKSTLGFRVDSSAELNIGQISADTDQYKAESFFKYLAGLGDMIHSAANKRHLDDFDWHRTVRIDSMDVGTTDFNLSLAMQNKLIAKGKEALETYLDGVSEEWHNCVSSVCEHE